MNEISINNINGMLTVPSLQVADNFGKQHKHVLEKISGLMEEIRLAENSTDVTNAHSTEKSMFIESTYYDKYGRLQKYYEVTRDVFSLLVMSFTGKKALAWKLRYIEAFNNMERQLININTNIDKVFSKELEEKIEDIVRKVTDEKMKNMVEEVIKAMDEKSEKIASDTCVTLRPAFIQLHEKINSNDKKFEKFSANFASEISGRLRPYFRSLDTKIKSFVKSSDRKSESISKAVGDNTKLMSAYIDALADMLK